LDFEISINDLKVHFNAIKALDGLSLNVKKGEILGIIGPNGSGKSTLLNCISRSVQPTGGDIFVLGKPRDAYTNQEFARIVGALLPTWPSGFKMKSMDIVLMGCRNNMKGRWWEGTKDLKIAEESLALLNASDLGSRDFDTLSSGEQRKVMIAKSLAQRTDIVLFDEPVAYLDLKHKFEVMDVLVKLSKEGKAVVVTLHDLDIAAKYCDKIIAIHHGKIAAAGKPREVITSELLKRAYDIDAIVKWDNELGFPVIVPTRLMKKEQQEAIPVSSGRKGQRSIKFPQSHSMSR
jgi:iron complex transport system ATP-binding protein